MWLPPSLDPCESHPEDYAIPFYNERLPIAFDVCDGKKECQPKRENNGEIGIILELHMSKLCREFLECGSNQ